MGDASFNNLAIPSAALGGFNYVSGPASADPVVKYTIERAMADIRAADKRTRHMLMIEAAAKQLAFQVVAYEETLHEEQVHDQHAQVQAQAQGHPPPPEAISKSSCTSTPYIHFLVTRYTADTNTIVVEEPDAA